MQSKSKQKLCIITMASILSISIITLLLILTIPCSSSVCLRHKTHSSTTPLITQACTATRFPLLCQSTLQTDPSTTPSTLISAAISLTIPTLKTAKSMVSQILTSSSVPDKNKTRVVHNCIDVLTHSESRIADTLNAAFSKESIKDSRAWIGAVLTNEYGCWSGLKYVNDTAEVNETMAFLDTLIQLTSNALSILAAYDIYGNDVASWRSPRTERDGFWEPISSSEYESNSTASFPVFGKGDVTVCKQKGCDFRTIQEAVNALSEKRNGTKYVIWIKEGVYDEIVRVPFEKKNVVFVGDGRGNTVITGNLSVGIQGFTTYESATVGVEGDGFMMSGVTVENTAGTDAYQAVAFRSSSDLSLIQGCEFIGNQDTLYASSLRQLYKNCRIVGNVDFIFGNSASIFQDCEILIAPRQLYPEKGETNAVSAQGRTDPAQSTGFVFQNCVINGTEDYLKYYKSNPNVHKNYLGRPWKEYSRTVFINCTMDGIVAADGWLPWKEDFALQTLYFGEFGNTGDGADLSGRVNWSSKIPMEHVVAYTPENFIQASEWVRAYRQPDYGQY